VGEGFELEGIEYGNDNEGRKTRFILYFELQLICEFRTN
jgi:hypothetical protein